MNDLVQTLFAWFAMLCVIAAAYPWAAWLHNRSPHHDGAALTCALTLAVSMGALTLIMFWLSIMGVPFTPIVVLACYAALMLLGLWLWLRDDHKPTHLPPSSVMQWQWWALAIISGATLFNAGYWVFSRADALGIYHAQAVLLAQTQHLLPLTGADSLYLTYPPLMQLAYAFTYELSGWHNEYLARIIPALMSVATLLVVFVLGRRLSDARGGGLSALLLATAPTFARWSSSGYVDLPMAFFYALAALFSFRLYTQRHWVNALLLGISLGLAAWTKNAALTAFPLIGIWLLWSLWQKRIVLHDVLIVGAACAVVAAPWYVRNVLGAGFLVPATAWVDQAAPNLRNLLIFITLPDNFGVTGWAIVAGIVLSLYEALRRRLAAPAHLLLLLLTMPFFAIWWLFTSYDPRFILLFLPLLCALASWALLRIWDRLPARAQVLGRIPVIVVAVVLVGYSVWTTLEYKQAIIGNPLMSHAEKLIVVGREAMPPIP
jgi:Dolichyl-phosphate-mannose-protein mannosyltransferase